MRDTVIDYIITESRAFLINKTLQEICQDYCISLTELKGRSREQPIAEARKEAYRKLKSKVGLNSQVIGKILERHRSTVERGQRSLDRLMISSTTINST